jgi:KOW motif
MVGGSLRSSLMTLPTLNLSAGDFDAYLNERATSNAYTRPRIEVKQRAMAWGRRVSARLLDLGIAVELHGSDEHPSLRNKKRVDCQWVFFWRDQAAREDLDRLLDQGRRIADAIDDPSPYTRHAFLALRIDARAIEVCFAVHPDAKVDVDNLRARLAPGADPGAQDGAERTAAPEEGATLAAEFTTALRRLPEQFTVGVGPAQQGGEAAATLDRVSTHAVDPDRIMDMLARAAAGQLPLWIGWSVPREVAIEHAAILDEQLEDAIVALAPIYQLVAWSRENDHIALDRRLEGVEEARARTHAEAEAETERWRAERALATERSREQVRERLAAGHGPAPGGLHRPARGPRPSLGTLFSPRRAAPSAASARGDDGADDPSRQEHPEATEPALPDQPLAASPAPISAPGAVEKGSRVRVLTGPFADKLGVVSEIDGRGGARVLLGLLSTRLDVVDLEPVVEGRERPALQSSHRRPAPPSPRKTR